MFLNFHSPTSYQVCDIAGEASRAYCVAIDFRDMFGLLPAHLTEAFLSTLDCSRFYFAHTRISHFIAFIVLSVGFQYALSASRIWFYSWKVNKVCVTTILAKVQPFHIRLSRQGGQRTKMRTCGAMQTKLIIKQLLII